MTLDTAITQIVNRQFWAISYSDLLPSLLFTVFASTLFVTHILISRMHKTYVEGYSLIQSLILLAAVVGGLTTLHFHSLHQSLEGERKAELTTILSHDFTIDATDFSDETFVLSYTPNPAVIYTTTLSRADLVLLQQVNKGKAGILTSTSAQTIDRNLDVSLLVQR